MDNKAQISLELLIIMAAIVATALLLISGIRSSSNSAESKLESNANKALKEIGKIK